tara:strand:+ start:12682 stop:13830 length:1149 start_codon:yes stop_codon:yes gene_type:complete
MKLWLSYVLAACVLSAGHTLVAPAMAQSADQGLRIGIMKPEEGAFSVLGNQIVNGINMLASSTDLDISEILIEPDTCDAAGGTDAASAFAEADVDAVIGFLCMESLSAALPILSSEGIPAITLGVRSQIIAEDSEQNGWLFYRLAPRADDETRMIAQIISTQWQGKPVALVDDGTIYGRELAESVRIMLEEKGQSPIFIDNFRPSQEKQFGLVKRLEKSGATHVFIGGDRQDAATIARDSIASGFNLTFLGGDALKAASSEPDLAEGVLAVTLPEPQYLPSARQAVAQFDSADLSANGYTIPAYAAGQILLAAKAVSIARSVPISQVLKREKFTTAIGMIAFDALGERKDNPFELMVWKDNTFIPASLAARMTPVYSNGENQ